MELLKAICFMGASILGVIYMLVFLFTGNVKYGIWVLIMGQVIIKLQ